ncbi:Response regulator receiver domain-containing protein [Oryzisolibacter propanilivorax]|uniref:Response regulator receiver domain-containing protein n=1 Tax=Oryzisolibacter propanilivorax TaxID=1527607 RepID=A0A1G9RC55_9BURK|nr:response regulator [Oryzisolibacter propanilivorax]SDM20889.1 Response regulator receiver domain-containing protein [Oryzisolibacter propanilivorax]
MTPDVLLVDDNPDACALLAELLQMQNYDVRSASTGAQALALMRERPAQLLLLDQNLPDMDGSALAQQLRALAEAQGRRCVAIAITGMASGRAGAVLPGFDHVLGKPLDFDAFDAVLEQSRAALG